MKATAAGQIAVERTENGDKEKKKKRRSNRRPRNNPVGSLPDEVHGEASDGRNSSKAGDCNQSPSPPSKQEVLVSHSSKEKETTTASNIAFNSLPAMHINKQSGPGDLFIAESQHGFSADPAGRMLSKSCPESMVSEYSRTTCVNKVLAFQQFEDDQYGRLFASHWSVDAVHEVLERGEAFKAVFRVNAHNRNEAYCKIEGVQTDVLINGIVAQNRAVEGDIVVIVLDPISSWPKMKGSVPNNSSQPEGYNITQETDELAFEGFKGNRQGDEDNETTRSKACQNDCASVEQFEICSMNSFGEQNDYWTALKRLSAINISFPLKRPTGRVVAIVEKSLRRDLVVGFLNIRQWLHYTQAYRMDWKKNKCPISASEYIQLLPTDPRFPKMVVAWGDLTGSIQKRLESGDLTVEMELVAAQICYWDEGSPCPQARIVHIFGRGGQLEPQINAILYQNSIFCSDFGPESLSCLPCLPWDVPKEEYRHRKDLRSLCIFTIDPLSATDLDDALSIKILSDGIFRVGVHIADVSHFVMPGTALDTEAQTRSTSVYMLQKKLPLLPPMLSENIGSLNPGVDRLAFSMFWDINGAGDVTDWWIGRTVVQSCCKLSYEHAQDIIEGIINMEDLKAAGNGWPVLYGPFEWSDVISSIKSLHHISKMLRQNRFDNGALQLESSKRVFLFDGDGFPYDTMLCGEKDSKFLVQEFMLLANRTAAEIISRAYPDSSLLRRHPEPNMRKLKEFEAFCSKHGLQLDTSSSGRFHKSLEQIREKLNGDSVFIDILINYATKPMQLANYFCSGDSKERGVDWNHYALAIPLYTHFTSPLRRYPDIVVHRTLAAAIEAEDLYHKNRKISSKKGQDEIVSRCFTGFYFSKDAAESLEGKKALSAAALSHGVPSTSTLADVAAYCNDKKLACRHVKDACEKLYTWLLLKKKQVLVSEARVLGLGPRFMSLYIPKLAIERRLYYDEVEGLFVEWLDTTSTLVLNKRTHRKGASGHYRALYEVAYIVNPYDLSIKSNHHGGTNDSKLSAMTISYAEESGSTSSNEEVDPGVFPLTVHVLSTIPIALHAIGGDDGPVDIGVRLYMSSYLK